MLRTSDKLLFFSNISKCIPEYESCTSMKAVFWYKIYDEIVLTGPINN